MRLLLPHPRLHATIRVVSDPVPTYAEARRAVLAVLDERKKDPERSFGRSYVLEQASRALGQWGDRAGGRLVMAAYDDLFRSGVINFGRALNQPGPEWGHLTAHGVETLREIERDPANAAGYLNAISPHLKEQPIAISYLVEALDTYNKGSVKASAVMLGCAAEALSLAMRDRLVAKIQGNGGTPPTNLHDWRIATVIRAMEQQLDGRGATMPRDLRERYESYWPAWSGLFRMTRNEVGHPKSVDPVTREAVHGALLLFHEHARLMFDLVSWVDASF